MGKRPNKTDSSDDLSEKKWKWEKEQKREVMNR